MPVMKKMEVSVVNLTTHPHSPEQYVELFQDAFKLRKFVDYRGVEKFILNTPMPIDRNDPTKGLYGFIHRFVDIDVHGAWMNVEKLETVEPEGDEPVINIPEELKPHCKTAPFVFFPKGHRMFFPSKDGKETFPASYTARALARLFNQPSLLEFFGEVEVNVESEEESIEHIMAIETMTKLVVSVALPNPDDFEGDEQRALERMQAQHARKSQIILTGDRNDSILPDDDTKGFMKLALSNGYVKAHGYQQDAKVMESTSEHPVVIQDSYPTDVAPMTRLLNIARNNLRRFTHPNGN